MEIYLFILPNNNNNNNKSRVVRCMTISLLEIVLLQLPDNKLAACIVRQKYFMFILLFCKAIWQFHRQVKFVRRYFSDNFSLPDLTIV